MYKDDRKDKILGTALANGLPRVRFRKVIGLSPATFDRRMADIDTITIGELRSMDEAANFPDDVLLYLIRKKMKKR